MKTCKEIYTEHDDEWHKMYVKYIAEMDKAKRIEFPIGTKVKWNHGLNYVHGTVIDYPKYYEERIIVQNNKTRNKREIEACLLELDI